MKDKILLIVPSRGRPRGLEEAYLSWEANQTGVSAFHPVIDNDDEEALEYKRLFNRFHFGITINPKRKRLGKCLNEVVKDFPDYKYYGFMGDDHRIRTKGWDKMIIDKIEKEGKGWGIVYGDDLLQHENLPTAVVISGNIIKTLGYMSPPNLIHLAIDRAWKVLGKSINRLYYMPEIIIEHMHRAVGKSPDDKTYQEANSQEVKTHDDLEFEKWKKVELPLKTKQILKKIYEV